MIWRYITARLLPCLVACAAAAPGTGRAQATDNVSVEQRSAVTQQKLDELGFARPGTRIEDDGYAQLLVSVVVPADSNIIELKNCPTQDKLWSIDLRNLIQGDMNSTLGLTISGPVIPSATYTPLILSVKAKGWFSHSCTVLIDSIRYQSPLFGVRRYAPQNLKVEPAYTSSRELSAEVRQDIAKLVGALSLVAGVPAASAAPYLSTLDKGLQSTGSDVQERVPHYFPIRSGPVLPPQQWIVPNALTTAKGKSPRSVVVIAQLVPVKAVVSRPSSASVWRPGVVLNTPYRVSASATPGNDTLSAYLYSMAGKEIDDYGSAKPAEANIACQAVSRKIDSIGLSEQDSALTLWAITRSRIDKESSTAQEVDNLGCMRDRWDVLQLAGIEKANATRPTGAPTVFQMKSTSDIDDALAVFFVAHTWQDRKASAARLFAYPVSYSDANKKMMVESTTIESRDGWLGNVLERDRQILRTFGCYAYFEGNTPHPFPNLAGRSVMVGFGDLPVGSGAVPGEVMLQMGFAPSALSEAPRIDSVLVQESISEEVRLAVLRSYGAARQCRSGYRPKLLFGG